MVLLHIMVQVQMQLFNQVLHLMVPIWT